MSRVIDYYLAPNSPWTYFGHERLVTIAKKAKARIAVKPCDFARVFSSAGGHVLAKRPLQRQSYRLLELARFSRELGMPINIQPKFFPVDAGPASCRIVAAIDTHGDEAALLLLAAIMKSLWTEEANIADPATLDRLATASGLDADHLRERAADPAMKARIETLTDEAVKEEIFGAPTYIPRFGSAKDQRFWGQDRLSHLEYAVTND